MSAKSIQLLAASICSLALVMSFADIAVAKSISPVQEQEFSEAEASVDKAMSIRAEQFAPAFMQRAQELMKMAASARLSQDAVLFSRASRLARTYAELAKTAAELQTDVGKWAEANESLGKTSSGIEK